MDWDEYYINIVTEVAKKSKDPSSKIGAVIVGPDHEIRSSGFNGFPRGIDEVQDASRWERPIKYDYVEHAERNAVYNAARIGVSTKGCTLYIYGFGPPCVPCINCTKAAIQCGITRIVGYSYKDAPEQWVRELEFSYNLLNEAGVEIVEYESSSLR